MNHADYIGRVSPVPGRNHFARMVVFALVATCVAAAVAAVAASSARADASDFGIAAADAAVSTDQAGAHPDFTTVFSLKRQSNNELFASARDAILELPPGLLGNPTAIPQCSAAQFTATDPNDKSNTNGCPPATQIGITDVELYNAGGTIVFTEPVFNLEPRFGEPARLGFIAEGFPIFIDSRLRSESDYGVDVLVENIGSLIPLLSATTTIWGVPADESHDGQRITAYEALHHNGTPETPNGKRSSGEVPTPFMNNPVRCGVEQGVNFIATSYALPELHDETFRSLAPNVGCGLLRFDPAIAIGPTTPNAETGSGLDVDLTFPSDGLEKPHLLGDAVQKRVEVALPPGLAVNPSEAAGGLGVCSPSDFARETATSPPDAGCPESSKIGTVRATSPLLDEAAEGSLFLAKPHDNPFGTLLALYMVLKAPERGVVVKLPGRVDSDPKTGQLVTTFGEPPYEIPQLPVSTFKLHFREGARAPLVTPSTCGEYTSTANFTSWSGQFVTTHPTFEITGGVNGGPCPSGNLPPFHPGLIAGSISNAAGHYSPFNLRLTREDGEQEITHFSIKLPPGVVGKLAGIPFCPDAAIAAAKGRTGIHGGEEELASPSCPAASEIGRTLVGAGVGQVLAYAPGKVYLAGPYHGSALSIAAITAAKVGPFDLGTVVVREALKVNPETGEVFIDATGSDPIPHIIQGIPVQLHDIRVYVDRPDFVLNPTSCEPTSTAATVLGSGLDFVSEADDNPIVVSTRYQAADCGSLPFHPRLSLKLVGGHKRGQTPSLRAHVGMNGIGEAAIRYAQVALPRSEFLDQGHIGTVCTRVEFRLGNVPGERCPRASVYGRVKALTPILAGPLEGSIYLRSSEHELPDLVAALHHQEINITLVGRLDSVKGGGIRNTFEFVPDAPVTSADFTFFGAGKGLLENSTNLCKRTHKAMVKLKGHNGKVSNYKVPVKATGCRKGSKPKRPSPRPAHRRTTG